MMTKSKASAGHCIGNPKSWRRERLSPQPGQQFSRHTMRNQIPYKTWDGCPPTSLSLIHACPRSTPPILHPSIPASSHPSIFLHPSGQIERSSATSSFPLAMHPGRGQQGPTSPPEISSGSRLYVLAQGYISHQSSIH